jgi:formate dehydrogenase iron-sulfur subunit
MSELGLSAAHDPAARSGWDDHPPRMGFFTDTSVCIGCKACEVACKEWNNVPDDGLDFLATSYDNTGALGADTWRHVAFIEQHVRGGSAPPDTPPKANGHEAASSAGSAPPDSPPQGREAASSAAASSSQPANEVRWLMSSDVCKHCTMAGCLEVCPTGALFRTEFGTVVVQEDVCNGCGYCVPACPFGVIDQRPDDGRVWKCTLCYDRIGAGMEPACAQACPTKSIQFGPLDELRASAGDRVTNLRAAGRTEAQLYGAGDGDGVGGLGAFFLLLDDPEVYGLPPDPVVPTRDLGAMWGAAAAAAVTLVAGVVGAVAGGRGRR